jgi:hypothetical protein
MERFIKEVEARQQMRCKQGREARKDIPTSTLQLS